MDALEQLSWYVPVLSIAFVCLLTSINAYIRIRRRFPIRVNCWFCAADTRTAYDARNSWTCPHCTQYNGFAADGDYNREIPAQRVARLNGAAHFAVRPHRQQQQQQLDRSADSVGSDARASSPASSNGLCGPCNLNQELKVQQLAAFELPPAADSRGNSGDDSARFDAALAAYQQQLEHAYRLCARCERHLHRRLNRVKRTVLGSKLLAQLAAGGVRAFDMTSTFDGDRATAATSSADRTAVSGAQLRRRRRALRLAAATLAVLAACAVAATVAEVRVQRARVREVLPAAAVHSVWVCVGAVRAAAMATLAAGGWLARTSVVAEAAERMGRAWRAIVVGRAEKVTAAGGVVADWMDGDGGARTEPAAAVVGLDVHVLAMDQRTLCVAAILLCALSVALRSNRFRQRGATLLALLAWSVKSVQPAVWTYFYQQSGHPNDSDDRHHPTTSSDAHRSVSFDLLRIAIDALIAGATLAILHSVSGRRLQADDLRSSGNNHSSSTASTGNGSFHRIYTEAQAGEMSADDDDDDDYFEEREDSRTVLSVSSASTTSPQQRQPTLPQFRHQHHHGYRTPTTQSQVCTGGARNTSADSTLSLSPTAVFTPRALHARTDTLLTSSIRSLNVSPPQRAPSVVQSQYHSMLAIPPPSQRYHSMQAGLDALFERRHETTHCNGEDADDDDDDVQSGITQLNIGGRRPVAHRQAAAVAASTTTTLASRFGSFDQLRQRQQSRSIIGPARLQQQQQQPPPLVATPTAAPSWVAGGFWGGGATSGALCSSSSHATSPTKRQQQQQQRLASVAPMPPVVTTSSSSLVCPLMSRTSSQSSGFESTAAVQQPPQRNWGSRESSVGPAGLAGLAASISPSDSVSQFGAEAPYRPASALASWAARPTSAAAAAASVAAFEPGSLLRSWQLRTSRSDISGVPSS